MAYFCSYPDMQRITEITLPNSLDPGSGSVTIGLWGFEELGGSELELQHPLIDIKKGEVEGAVQLYELSSFHTGRWFLEARTAAGVTNDPLTVTVAGAMHTALGGLFAGFDRLAYPGDTVMKNVINETNLRWCGFYLAPAPSQGNTSWMAKRSFLTGLGWGLAPIYVGQQSDGLGSHTVTAAQGTLDAQDTAKLAKSAGFPSGSIIFPIWTGSNLRRTAKRWARISHSHCCAGNSRRAGHREVGQERGISQRFDHFSDLDWLQSTSDSKAMG